MPQRVQRKRTAGWRMPPNTVSVCRPGRYGNPFHAGGRFAMVDQEYVDAFRDMAEYLYRNDRAWRERMIADLRGRNLACFCKHGTPCHADVLLELANRPEFAHSP
jgi:hypothetical protein